MDFWQALKAANIADIGFPRLATGLVGWITIRESSVYLVDSLMCYQDSKILEVRILNSDVIYPMVLACSWHDAPLNADQVLHHSIVDGDLSHDQEIGITIRRLRVRLKPGDDHVEVNLSDSSIAAAKQKLGAFQIYRAPPRDWMDYYR
jgi:hypothetical protein